VAGPLDVKASEIQQQPIVVLNESSPAEAPFLGQLGLELLKEGKQRSFRRLAGLTLIQWADSPVEVIPVLSDTKAIEELFATDTPSDSRNAPTLTRQPKRFSSSREATKSIGPER